MRCILALLPSGPATTCMSSQKGCKVPTTVFCRPVVIVRVGCSLAVMRRSGNFDNFVFSDLSIELSAC